MRTRGCMHVITLLINESYIQYGILSILQEGKEQPTLSSWLISTICTINLLQLPTRFSLALKLFPKFSIPGPFVLVVVSYHSLNGKVCHLYTMCIRVWFRLDRSTTKFLPRTNKIF